MKTASRILGLVAIGLCLLTAWLVAEWLWLTAPFSNMLWALVTVSGAACAGRWGEYLADLAEEPTNAGE